MLVELHCHSNHSDGEPSVRQIIKKAEQTLDAVAITDHNSLGGYREARKMKKDVLLIPGVEITCTMGKRKGHVLALGVEEFKQGDVFEVLDSIKQSGGISIIAHPIRGLGYSFDSKEIWRKADAIEVLNGGTMMFKNIRAYQQAKKMRMKMTSGSDAHLLRFVGKYACEIQGNSADDILKSIKKGRVVIPEKTTNIFNILFFGATRKSKRGLRKILR